tara:strand:+ start:430 stop:1176 length:747 start_codon:yes stop_codon:yes gene_type:complete
MEIILPIQNIDLSSKEKSEKKIKKNVFRILKSNAYIKRRNFNKIQTIMTHMFEYRIDKLNGISSEINVGGTIRQQNGKLGEDFVEILFNHIVKFFFEDKNIIIKNGNKKEEKKNISITSKNGETFTKKHSVDIHVYFNNELKICVECKSYLDSCYFGRALLDFHTYKQDNNGRFQDMIPMIFAFEEAADKNTLNFEMANLNIYPNIFYMLDGNRSSKKAYWKPKYRKQINQDKLLKFIKHIYNIFDNF